MSPDGMNPEALPYVVKDLIRRVETLEREKLSTEVALIKRDVSDIKRSQDRRFDELDGKVDLLMDDRGARGGARASWKNALTVGLVSLVLVLGLVFQIAAYFN